ncbi:MAG: sigma-70 family RNA polymerase sigma factor [bacterium]|nr:sigma-70 family RNA polymerase sigma factor [bacterium]
MRNRSGARPAAAPVFNAAFWEVPLEAEQAQSLRQEDHLYYESAPERSARLERREREPQLLAALKQLMDDTLSARQQEVVKLYYFEHKTEDEIADAFGIARQVVNQHLFGIRRGGRRIGGAVKKLRKAARQKGLC